MFASLSLYRLFAVNDDGVLDVHAAQVVLEREHRILHLVNRPALELAHQLAALPAACAAERMAAREKPAVRVDGHLAAHEDLSRRGERASLPFLAEAELLGLYNLGDSEAVMGLRHLNILG